jgi:type II secretory pathway pseudopilin PulG
MGVRATRIRRRPPTGAAGLTLIEVVLTLPIVGVMLVAALSTVGMARLTDRTIEDGRRGMTLAEDLMSEVLRHAYADPEDGAAGFGPEPDESARKDWDDVDDYHGWSASPPEHSDGTRMDELKGWRRSVQVVWVDPSLTSAVVGADGGAKRVTVAISRDGKPITTLTALRTVVSDD